MTYKYVPSCAELSAYLYERMEEAKTKQQLLEGSWLLAVVEESWIADWVIQVALQQVGSQALHRNNTHMDLYNQKHS